MSALARRCDICAVITDMPYRRGDGTVVCRPCIVSAVDRADELDAAYQHAVAIRLAAIRGCEHTTFVAYCGGGCERFR